MRFPQMDFWSKHIDGFSTFTRYTLECLVVSLFSFIPFISIQGQIPFNLENQRYLLFDQSFELVELGINSSNNALIVNSLSPSLGPNVNALAFRKTDRLLYAIEPDTRQMIRIDAAGNIELIAILNLDPTMRYLAGDITSDGRYYVLIGSVNDFSRAIFKVDLEDPAYSVQVIQLAGALKIADIAIRPDANMFFGIDRATRGLVGISLSNFQIVGYPPVNQINEVFTVFFDAFGDLYGYGTTAFGVADALFLFDRTTGKEKRTSTGAVYPIADGASCPYSIEMQHSVSDKITFPCVDLEYSYLISNGSGSAQSNINFQEKYKSGFSIKEIVRNPFGGNVSITGLSRNLDISGMTIPQGIDSLIVRVEVLDIPGGVYASQANLSNLPDIFGGNRLADDIRTLNPADSLKVTVNRVEEDSLYFTRFFCLGDSITLDGSEFGSNVMWDNGVFGPYQTVHSAGFYTMNVGSGCQSVEITFEVTTASCPFRIALDHLAEPAETFPCSEILYRYAFDNASGVVLEDIVFIDTLPDGLKFIEVVDNPFGGDVLSDGLPNIVRINSMTLPLGIDTLDLLISVGNLPPGTLFNEARMENIPVELGPFRVSDWPETDLLDETPLVILGLDSDTVHIDTIICRGVPMVLDAATFGTNHQWGTGSTEEFIIVKEPGTYDLIVFDGCDPTFIFFHVRQGPDVYIEFDRSVLNIRLGDSIVISSDVYSEQEDFTFLWSDPTTLSCHTCQEPMAKPLLSQIYQLTASNGLCQDSAKVWIEVDNTRRIFLPNLFSPNNDGVNDYFFVQSPDYGEIQKFEVFDRWGNQVFDTDQMIINEKQTGWDGTAGGLTLLPGVYIWRAEIRFLDGLWEIFNGDVLILK